MKTEDLTKAWENNFDILANLNKHPFYLYELMGQNLGRDHDGLEIFKAVTKYMLPENCLKLD